MYYQESDFRVADRVGEVAKELGVNPAQVALAWMLGKEGITAPIIGATKAHHLDDAVKALEIHLSTRPSQASGGALSASSRAGLFLKEEGRKPERCGQVRTSAFRFH